MTNMTTTGKATTVEQGVKLIRHIHATAIDLPEFMDRIEVLTTDPRLTREILETAKSRGIIDVNSDNTVVFQRAMRDPRLNSITHKEGKYTCKRCGSSLVNGYFIGEQNEIGPFGPECVRKLTDVTLKQPAEG